MRLTKDCACVGTSSGPRVVISGGTTSGGTIHGAVSWVQMACDICDAPWLTALQASEAPPLDHPEAAVALEAPAESRLPEPAVPPR